MAQQTVAESRAVIEDVGPSRKKLTITIPGEAVTEQLETSMAALMSDAQLPGFRRGHVPRQLIEKRFGEALNNEAKNQLVSSAYSKALEDHKISVLGEPEGADELKEVSLQKGKSITFSVEVEVPPAFDIPSLDGIEVKKPIVEVKDEHVQKQIEKICQTEGSLEEQDSAQAGDYCIGHGVMKGSDGAVLLDIQGAVIQIPPKDSDGKGAILGVLVQDFAKQLGLPKKGDLVKIKTKGPENHEDPAIRGKDVVIEYSVEQAQRIRPATPGDLVGRFGLSDEQHLREVVTLRLNQRAMLEQQTAMRQQIANFLLEQVEMELPKRLSERQAARNLERQRLDMLYRGLDESRIERRLAEMRDSSVEHAQRELKLFFILARAADKLEVTVNEAEVNNRIAQIAADRGIRPDQLRNDLIQRNRIAFIVQQIREHKTLDAILSKAKVHDIPVDQYNKEVAKKSGDGAKIELNS